LLRCILLTQEERKKRKEAERKAKLNVIEAKQLHRGVKALEERGENL